VVSGPHDQLIRAFSLAPTSALHFQRRRSPLCAAAVVCGTERSLHGCSGELLLILGLQISQFLLRRKMMEPAVLEQAGFSPVSALAPAPEPAPQNDPVVIRRKLTREQLSRVPTPSATATHKPIPHGGKRQRRSFGGTNPCRWLVLRPPALKH